MIKSTRIGLVNNIVLEINSNRQDYTAIKSNMHKSLLGLINSKIKLLALIFALLNFA
jgi:hypothetical protein